MYNLYQSQVRKDLQTKIYQKKYLNINIFGKNYFALIKGKKIGPFNLQWLQIMGVELPDNKKIIKSELKKIKKKYKKQFLFIQFAMLNEITTFHNVGKREEIFIQDIKKQRINIQNYIKKQYKLKPTIRENMPQANIVYDITKTDEQLMSEMNSGCKARVKKAQKEGIKFDIASPDQYDIFYKKRIELSGQKGFNIITKKQYDTLVRYLTQNNRGNLFVSHLDGDLIAGSICLYDEHRIIYLYGFSNRKYSNIGGHHYLKFKIFGYARKLGMTYVDMLGGAPTGFDKHPLVGVSKFKESLGGTKIEQYGSYDLVLNKILYNLTKIIFKLKHK